MNSLQQGSEWPRLLVMFEDMQERAVPRSSSLERDVEVEHIGISIAFPLIET